MRIDLKRFVYKVDPVAKTREVIGSFEYPAANITGKCTVPGERYPDPEARSGFKILVVSLIITCQFL